MRLRLTLDEPSGGFAPRDRIAGSVEVNADGPWECDRAEVVLFWRTEGRGDEDHGVAEVLELAPPKQSAQPSIRRSFLFTAPVFPWTYHGRAIKIHWVLGVYVKEKRQPEEHEEVALVIHPRHASFAAKAPELPPPPDWAPPA